jgi:hypothetical protein
MVALTQLVAMAWVNRWVCDKITQIVAQPIFVKKNAETYVHIEYISPNMWGNYVIFKELVTLALTKRLVIHKKRLT